MRYMTDTKWYSKTKGHQGVDIIDRPGTGVAVWLFINICSHWLAEEQANSVGVTKLHCSSPVPTYQLVGYHSFTGEHALAAVYTNLLLKNGGGMHYMTDTKWYSKTRGHQCVNVIERLGTGVAVWLFINICSHWLAEEQADSVGVTKLHCSSPLQTYYWLATNPK
jgi:hypothetical protein